MSAPEAGTSARQVVPLDVDGPKQVGWHDHHGMELTHVREFEPSEPSDSDDESIRGRRSGNACCVIQ